MADLITEIHPHTPIANEYYHPGDAYTPESTASTCTLCPQLSLYHWALVNRVWNAVATPLLYRKLNLNIWAIPGRTVARPVFIPGEVDHVLDFGGRPAVEHRFGLVWAEATESDLVGKWIDTSKDPKPKYICSEAEVINVKSINVITRPDHSANNTNWFGGKDHETRVTNNNLVDVEVIRKAICPHNLHHKVLYDPTHQLLCVEANYS